VPVTPGPGCSKLDPFGAECNVDAGPGFVRAFLGSGNDSIDPANGNPPVTTGFSVDAGTGNDDLVGTARNDILDGGAGVDEIEGGLGPDTIHGAAGVDTLSGDAGNDTITGGLNDDTLSGGTGLDDMFGNAGDDTLNADDNAGLDEVDCGDNPFDDDLAIFTVGDIVVSSSCERQQQG